MEGARDSRPPLPPGFALLVLALIALGATGVVLLTLWLIKDQDAVVAIPAGSVIGLVVVVASLVGIAQMAKDLWGPPAVRPADPARGLSIGHGIIFLLSFVVLTVVPAGVVVAAVTLLGNKDHLIPEIVLPIILLVGLIGLVAVLALLVEVYRRVGDLDKQYPLGLPQGTIQAVIALSVILIFAIIGVYLYASAAATDKHEVGIQLLTTTSTLVVAVASFYFGAKSTRDAADRAIAVVQELRGPGGGGTTPTTPDNPPI
jgi:hypothetical protein